MILAFLAALSLWAPPVCAQTPDLAWAMAQQETFPAWSARKQAGEQRAEARAAWFAGKVDFAVAFPHLHGAALNDSTVLRGRLSLLDQAAIDRAAERLDPVPDLGASKRAQNWQSHRDAALDAEETADAYERRLLVQSAALLARYRDLKAEAVEGQKARWKRQIEVAAAIAVGDPAGEAADRRAALADGEIRRLEALIPQIRDAMLRPGIGALDPSDEFDRLPSDGIGPAIRLGLMAPALIPTDAVAVERSLEAWWTAAGAIESVEFEDGIALSVLEARVDELRAVQQEHRNAIAALAPDRSPSDAARRATLEAWAAAAGAHVDAGDNKLRAARGWAPDGAESVR